jgi:hypothetical protein
MLLKCHSWNRIGEAAVSLLKLKQLINDSGIALGSFIFIRIDFIGLTLFLDI